MRWQNRRRSENVEDRRGMRGRGPMMAGGGIIGLVLVIVVVLLGGDPRPLLQGGLAGGPAGGNAGAVATNPAEDKLAAFVAVVLADTEEVWGEIFRQNGLQYQKPKLVLFSGQVRSACGFQSAAVGPFYCPLDQKVYIDLTFFQEMSAKLGAPGDFAQAYVIAHEVGHHVQNLTGISGKVNEMQRRLSKTRANELSVRQELQADFYAGVWAHHAERKWDILEEGDIREALNAASAIGDDKLQKQAQGYVVPDNFTHGTSEQRARWFLLGLKTGDMNAGDTFSIRYEAL